MKTTVIFTTMLLTGVSALDMPESSVNSALSVEEQNRNLFLFNNLRCQRRTRVCQATLGVDKAPLERWSKFLAPIAAQEQDSPLAGVKKIIDTAATLDMGEVFDGLTASLAGFDLGKMIKMVQGLLSSAIGIKNAIQGGNIFEAITMIMGMLSSTNGVFGTATNGITGLIESITDSISDMVGLMERGVMGMKQIQDTFKSVTEYLTSFYTSFLELFNPRSRTARLANGGDDTCEVTLMACENERLLTNAIPNLISLAFVSAANQPN